METKSKLIFSVFSGTFYEILECDLNLLDVGQIPLLKRPKNCSKCYNRGYSGRDSNTFAYNLCNCVRKVIDYPQNNIDSHQS